MKENFILNNNTKEYAKKCIDEIVDIGIEFKLQDDFRKTNIIYWF